MFIGLLMLWGLPESLQFLAVRRRRLDLLAKWLRKLDPGLRIDAATQFITRETPWRRHVHPQFHDGRALGERCFVGGQLMTCSTGIRQAADHGDKNMGYDSGTAVLIRHPPAASAAPRTFAWPG